MSASGDLRAVLSLDDFEYVAGMREAAAATDALGAHAEAASAHLEHSLHRSIHKGAHLASSFAFMLSEGKGVEDMKGKFEQLAMIAPMVGLAIGGWAGPIGIAAGIVGSALIPQLLEGQKVWEGITEATKEAGKELEAYAKRREELSAFEKKIGEAKSQEEISKLIDEKKIDEQNAKARFDDEAKHLDRLKRQRAELTEAAKAGGKEGSFFDFLPGSLISEAFGGPKASDIIGKIAGKIDIEPQLAEMDKQIKEHQEALRKKSEEFAHAGEMRRKAEEAVAEGGAPEGVIKREKELIDHEKKRLELAEKIAKEIETPFEHAQDRVMELQRALQQGVITPEMFERGSAKAMEEFLKPGGTNAAALAGTSESFRQIRESIREAGPNEADKAFRQAAEQRAKQLLELEKINKNLENNQLLDVNVA